MATFNKINSKMIEATLGYGEQIYSRRGAMLAYTGRSTSTRRRPRARAWAGSSGAWSRASRCR